MRYHLDCTVSGIASCKALMWANHSPMEQVVSMTHKWLVSARVGQDDVFVEISTISITNYWQG